MTQTAENIGTPQRAAIRTARGVQRVAADTLWLARDCARRYAKRVVLAVTLGILGQLTMIAAVAGAFVYVQAVQTEGAVSLRELGMGPLRIPASLSIDPSSSPFALLALIGAVFVVILVAASLQWLSKSVGANIVRRYEDDCTRRALVRLGDALRNEPTQPRPGDPKALRRSLLKLLTRDSRYCGRAANEAILAATPALTAVVTLLFLLRIGWLPIAVLLGIVVLVAPLYVRVNRRGMQSMARLEVLARRDALVKSDVIGKALASGASARLDSAILDNTHSQRYLDEYEVRLKMGHASLFVGNILFAAALCTTLLFFGLFHGRGISATLVVYLVGLQYLMYSLRNLGKSITNMSVYHTAFGRYVLFIRTGSLTALEQQPETTIAAGDDELLDETLQG